MKKKLKNTLLILAITTAVAGNASEQQKPKKLTPDVTKAIKTPTAPTLSKTILPIKPKTPELKTPVTEQEESLSYWTQFKAKLSQQLQPFYNWYKEHKATINPAAKSIVAAGISKLLYNYLDQNIKESYRIKNKEEGQGYLQEPKTPGSAVSGQSLPFTGTGFASKEEMNKRYNIDMSEDLYQKWLDHSSNIGKK